LGCEPNDGPTDQYIPYIADREKGRVAREDKMVDTW